MLPKIVTLTQLIIVVDSMPTQIDTAPQVADSFESLLHDSSRVIELDLEQTLSDPVNDSPNLIDCSLPTVLGLLADSQLLI